MAGELGNAYLSKPDGSFEPVGIGSEGTEPLAQGRYISPDGRHVIFSTGKQPGQSVWCGQKSSECEVRRLEPDAAPTGTGAIYDREANGGTHVVSLLPAAVKQEAGQQAFYQGASRDGSSIAFKMGETLYVRVNSGEGGEKTEEAAPGVVYAGLSADGRYLFYVEGGEDGTIHRLDTEAESDLEINSGAEGEVVNVSADGSHVYFISEVQIAGQGTPDQPNLYVWNEAAVEFVTTVAPSDLERTSGTLEKLPALTRWTSQAVAPVNDIEVGPGADSSRTTPDGGAIVFESKAELTGYENAGHTEVYRWAEGAGGVTCVSCEGGPEPATADARLQELTLVGPGTVIHNLTDDGSRVFFETGEDLSSDDTDEGVNDIYEWTEGSLGGSELISSGHSEAYPLAHEGKGLPVPNVLYSVTPSGGDVVFTAQDVLVPGAGEAGTQAIYDARVNGGFPPAPAPSPPCTEERCRRATSAPGSSFLEPQSDVTAGKGNVKPQRKRRCSRSQKKKGGKAHGCKRRHGKHGGGAGKRRLARSSAAAEVSPSPSSSSSSAEVTKTETQAPSASATPSTSALIGDFNDFGIESFSGSLSTTTAGAHPDFSASFSFTHGTRAGRPWSDAHAEEISVSLPPGLLGNPNAIPRCRMGEFVAFANCETDAQVGVARVLITNQGRAFEPIYNLEPPHPKQEVARLGFMAAFLPVFIDVKVRTASDYGVTATVHSPPSLSGVLESETILWGNPADESHDAQRLTAVEALTCSEVETACKNGGSRPSTIPVNGRKPFMTNPSGCDSGQLGLRVTSYQLPGKVFNASAPLTPITDCSGLPFAPSFTAEPTSHVAGAPTGLSTKLTIPQHEGPDERATATMREARVTLPAGMQVNPGAANWIEPCSAEQVGYQHEVDAGCPDGSRLGTAKIFSPALPEAIEGAIYQRTPEPGHQLGLWLVADQLGLHIKLPGELEPDKQTGRLTAIFRDLPQVPVSEIDLDVWGGDRAPLQNPDSCGTYATDFSFAPHSSDPLAVGSSQMQIDQGCGRPFGPKLKAGVAKPVAGKYSPLIVDLLREDNEQGLRGFELILPDGELAKIKGVARCSDAAAQAGACPEEARIGTVTAITGVGPDPLAIPQPGKPTPAVYLGGPYEGSPLSVVTIAPAQAGPFDLGHLVVRSGLGLDPDTNRAVIDVDPLPQFFEGVGLSYRRLHVVVDRPDFSLNPTDCREMAVDSTVTSMQGAVAHPSTRFQVDGCKALKFAPKLALTLKGGTKRADYPALTAVLKARKGDANIARATVALPHSEFLAQEHIGTICTRKQFAVDACPKGSVYGTATAWSPLLAKPLSGPVYLRSSNNVLPDLVAALSGELDVNLAGRIDSTKAGGIRTTFEAVPDAPVTKFVLRMRGGAKGLITNSTDACRRTHRAVAALRAQNGRASNLRPVLQFKGCAKHKRRG